MSFKGKEHNPESFLKYSNITTESMLPTMHFYIHYVIQA